MLSGIESSLLGLEKLVAYSPADLAAKWNRGIVFDDIIF